MKIGLNLLHARPEIGGGWNYIANVVDALTLLDSHWRFVAYCTEESIKIVPSDSRFEIKLVRLSESSQLPRLFYEQFVLPIKARQDGIACMHWFANNVSLFGGSPSVSTVHDFKFIENPSEVGRIKGFYLRYIARAACKRAQVLAPVSETTAGKATQLFNVSPDRMIVIPNPLGDQFRPAQPDAIRGVRGKLNLPPQFWLYVAHLYPHKNHIRLLNAYKQFRESSRSEWPLVLRGDGTDGRDELERMAVELGIEKSVMWLPRLAVVDMVSLYSAATALIFPSLYEGGGIPVLEAMACGCPVAASDIPTTREFAGLAALRFDPQEVESISGAMRRLAADQDLRDSCRAEGLRRAREYSRELIAKRIDLAYCRSVAVVLAESEQLEREWNKNFDSSR